MNPVRIAVIGIGNMGTGHCKYLNKGEVPNAVLAAVCDNDPARHAWIKANLDPSVKIYNTTEELFNAGGIDAILVATPHYDHTVLAVEGFKRGLHVLIEKPAGVCVKQVREMNAAAEKSDRVFGIMFQQRTSPMHQKMRELATGGELGEIRRLNWIITDWYRTQQYYDSGGWRATWAGEGGGVLLNQCPHNLDLFQWISGMMPKRVRAFCAFGKYHDIEVEDDVTGYFEYDNGATGLFITTTGEAPGTNRFEITGDNGKLVLERGKLTFFRNRVPMNKHLRECPTGFERPECWEIPIEVRGTASEHRGITENFVQAIQNGTPLLAPGIEGIRGLSLSNAMHMSAWTDAWVDLPMDEDAFYNMMQEKIKNSRFVKKAPAGGQVADLSSTYNTR